MTTHYERKLDELRKKYDLWPWMEVSKATLPGAAPVGSLAPFSIQQPYRIIWDKMPFVGLGINPFNSDAPAFNTAIADLSVNSGIYNWAIGMSSSRMQESQNQVAVEDLLGSYNDKWNALPKGGDLPKDEVWQAQFNLGQWYNGGAGLPAATAGGTGMGASLFTGLRGYRCYEKNSIHPLQMSRKEMLKSGKFSPRAYTYSGIVVVNFSLATPQLQSTQLTFGPPFDSDCDFMCHRIRIRPQGYPLPVAPFVPAGAQATQILQYMQAVYVNIVPLAKNTPYLGGDSNNVSITLAPWQMIMGVDYSTVNALQIPAIIPPPRLETQWVLPHPVIIGNNERYNLQAQTQQLDPVVGAAVGGDAANWTLPMEFLFDGELLFKK